MLMFPEKMYIIIYKKYFIKYIKENIYLKKKIKLIY